MLYDVAPVTVDQETVTWLAPPVAPTPVGEEGAVGAGPSGQAFGAGDEGEIITMCFEMLQMRRERVVTACCGGDE